VVRRVGPIAKVVYQAVVLRVEMDVVDKLCKIGLGTYFFSAKSMLEQAPDAVVTVVYRFSVGIEQVSQLALYTY